MPAGLIMLFTWVFIDIVSALLQCYWLTSVQMSFVVDIVLAALVNDGTIMVQFIIVHQTNGIHCG